MHFKTIVRTFSKGRQTGELSFFLSYRTPKLQTTSLHCSMFSFKHWKPSILTYSTSKTTSRMCRLLPEVICRVKEAHACVYIYIRQLSSFMAPTLWFIDLTAATCHIQYTSLSLCQGFFFLFTIKRPKHENTRSPLT